MPSTTLPRGNVLVTYVLDVPLTPVAVLANITAEQSFTIQGLQVGDFVSMNAEDAAQTAGIGIVNVRVSAANTLTVSFSNSTSGTLTPTATDYFISIDRPEGPPPANLV